MRSNVFLRNSGKEPKYLILFYPLSEVIPGKSDCNPGVMRLLSVLPQSCCQDK